MSDVQNTTAPTTEATEPTTTATSTEQPEALTTDNAVPAEEAQQPVTNGEPATGTLEPAAPVAAAEEKKDEAAPAATEQAEKTIEPVTEGQLGYKGPGLLKSLIPSKKEFWLSDSPVTPQHMHLYMRGEKPETSNAVVAWASQTGKGLLFFNKKGETSRTHPQSVLPLYDATELKKSHPHEITFQLHGHPHTLKAANDTERDGWYISLERAMEVAKADKESVRDSEGYKAEMEKLNKPNTFGTMAGAATGAKAAEHDKTEEPRRAGSDDVEKKQKSRSTSRGMLNKLKGKKDEMETKREEKKEEKKEGKEEKKVEKDEAKEEKKAEKTGVAAPAAIGGAAVLDAPGTAERVMGAPVEDAQEPVAESGATTSAPTKTDEKPKPSKRGSIFGRVQSAFSPSREKDQKEAELKPEVPPKDAGVSETAPQIPEPTTATTDAAEPAAVPEVSEPTTESTSKPAEAAKEQLDTISPAQKKGGFLSGLGGFMNKRDRSVSPSANMKEPAKKEETPIVPPKDETTSEPADLRSEEPSKPVDEAPAATEAVDTPADKTDEPAKAAETISPTANKRQSVIGGFGNLGRRASKAFKGFNQPPKKENTTPVATEAKNEEPTEAAAAADKPTVNGESKAAETHEPQSIGDVVPDAVNIGQAQTTPTVTASA